MNVNTHNIIVGVIYVLAIIIINSSLSLLWLESLFYEER